jgi:glutathione S-transferase
MALTFYSVSGSVFGWRVQLTLEHKGVKYESRILSASKGELKAPEYLAINPHGKVPAIVDDGFALYESAAICEYLEERFPQTPRLFPSELRPRALVRRAVGEVDSTLAVHALALARNLYFKSPDAWNLVEIEVGRHGIVSEIARLERNMADDFLLGPELTAADFACYPFFAHMRRYERKKPDLALHAQLGPKLNAWLKRIETLPYFETTYPAHWR